ncbi:MAG: SGNH/GDSL hydrolase family protein [Proteobacteria bacterium]|nr:SGNH/GDSL hydrolase family protein [Pseudomonadota bacterium]
MNSPAAQRLPRASRLREGLKRLALVVGSVLFGLMMLELGLRALDGWRSLAHWPNLVLQARTASWDRHTVHDPRLGFVPRPDYYWYHGMAHYDAHSDRLTPAPPGMALAEPPVLVLGDSFAHGDEIDDSETWPTRLQPLIHRRVVNAAMSGYGIDQMVLRGEIEAAREKPAAIVLSFIADDVRRMEMKRVWGAEKPWFTLVDGQLVERNVPVPPSPDPATTLDLWHTMLGRSVLVETVLKSLGWWYEWTADHVRVMPSGDGLTLVCPLFQRLAGVGVPVLVVGEYAPFHWQNERFARTTRQTMRAVLTCADAAGFATLDLFDTIDAGVAKQGLHTIFRQAHPGPAGTALAAQAIAAELAKRHMLPIP